MVDKGPFYCCKKVGKKVHDTVFASLELEEFILLSISMIRSSMNANTHKKTPLRCGAFLITHNTVLNEGNFLSGLICALLTGHLSWRLVPLGQIEGKIKGMGYRVGWWCKRKTP